MHEPGDTRREAAPSRSATGPDARTDAPAHAGLPEVPGLTRVLLDSMTEGVSLSAEDGTILYTNPAEDRMFGYAPGALVGRHVSVQNAYPPEENARIVGEVIAELRRSGAWTGEWLNRRKDGSAFVTKSRISAIEIDGRTHWLCVQEDVTEQKQAGAELRESRARLELATEAAELGIWDWDIATGRMTYSPRAKAICGFAADQDVTLEDARRVTHPDDLPRTSAMARRALDPAIREREPYEYRLLRADGSVRWVVAKGEAVFAEAEGGAPRAVRYVGTLQDVTERRRLEEEQAAGQARLRLAVEAGGMAVWEVDLATGRVVGSPDLNRLLGFPEDATPSLEELRARCYPGERERLQALGQAALARGERAIEAEYRYVWPDRSVRWLMLRAEIRLDDSARPAKAVGVVMDVTERKRSEAVGVESAARLKRRSEQLQGLAEAALEVALAPALEATLDVVTRAARRIIGAHQGVVSLTRGPDWSQAITAVALTDKYGRWRDYASPPDGSGVYAWLCEENRAVRMTQAELEAHPRWRGFGAQVEAHPPMRGWLAAPLVGRDGRNLGLIQLSDKEDGSDFDEADEAMLVQLAQLASASVEQNLAEAALRASEARLRSVVLAAPFPIMLHAENGEVLELSRKWTELTGYARDEIGTHFDWIRRAYPEDLARIERMIAEEFKAEGEIAAGEMTVRVKDGSTRVWDFYNVGLGRLPDGRRLQISAAADVTDRKRAQEALRRLNESLESQVAERTAERDRIWNLPRDLMCVARLDGTLLSVNPAWRRLLGWPVEWLTGRNVAEIKHPDDAERTAAALARSAAGHSTVGFEDRYRHMDGSWRWISWAVEPEGDLLYCVGRDVTAEKEARAALEAAEKARREADALYRAYFENTAEALFVIGVLPDGGFTIEELNPAHEVLTGLRTAEIRGRRVEEQLPPETAEAVSRNYRRAVREGRPIGYREVLEMPGGTRHWDTVLVPVRGPEGRITRLIGSGRDVTAQVQAEEQLRQAQKMEAVGQLTGGIAHDFNNLLGALVGSLDLIRLKAHDAEGVRRYAEAGLRAAERGAKLTGQLLAFSRAQRIELKPLVLSDLVAGMQDMLARTLGPMVRLRLDLDAEAAAVLSDPTQLEMAVLNLAINARDAMPGGGALTIATALRRIRSDPELGPGDHVELAVSDTGAGMTPDVAARAFDPFFTTKGVGKGTGLGLSQVYGIARQAGGTVRIESRPGAGATIRILLPRTDAQPRAGGAAEADGRSASEPAATVLVVDDDPDIRRVLVESLGALGYRVVEAADGPAGLAALDAGAPDLMMVDFAMPGMNGAEMAKAARERRPDLPIVFASGYADTAAVESVAGPDATILRKPFRIDDLRQALAAALARA